MEEQKLLAESIGKELTRGRSVKIRPLITILNSDRFQQSKNFETWMNHYLRLTKPFDHWTPLEKQQLLMISIGEEAANLYDLATKKTQHQNPFEDMCNTLRDVFCLPQPQIIAQIEFYNTRPSVGEKTLSFLKKLKERSLLCKFGHERDKNIMRMLLYKTNDPKWLEESIKENWTEDDLSKGELYARNLEQWALMHKRLKECYIQKPETKAKKKYSINKKETKDKPDNKKRTKVKNTNAKK